MGQWEIVLNILKSWGVGLSWMHALGKVTQGLQYSKRGQALMEESKSLGSHGENSERLLGPEKLGGVSKGTFHRWNTDWGLGVYIFHNEHLWEDSISELYSFHSTAVTNYPKLRIWHNRNVVSPSSGGRSLTSWCYRATLALKVPLPLSKFPVTVDNLWHSSACSHTSPISVLSWHHLLLVPSLPFCLKPPSALLL